MSDQPFIRKNGDDQVTAMANRIGALERIKFLSGIDLRDKSTEYKQLIDCEMYLKHYKDQPQGILIDEDFCQRTANIMKQFESEEPEKLELALKAVPERVEQLFNESRNNKMGFVPPPIMEKRNAFMEIIRKFLPKRTV